VSEFDVPLNTSSPLVPVRVTANATRGVEAVSRSNIVTAMSANVVVVVIDFIVFAALFVFFIANLDSLCITMLILSISLKIMQIDSVGP
jgi:hypothetical protein